MLIVGLGNPGSEYERTRHNVGFMVIDHLCEKLSVSNVSKSSFFGDVFKYKSHIFLKPNTFMNLSGKSVLSVKQFFKCEEICVIHDDLDLPFGAVRFKVGGGSGGHNGLKSIDGALSPEYIRLRMGIGKPDHKGEVSSYVLSPFSQTEQSHLEEWIAYCSEAAVSLLSKPYDEVQSLYTVKKPSLLP